MKFPILSFMPKLVLSVPVDSAMFGVEFDESVIANAFVVTLLGNRVAVGLKELVGELLGNHQVLHLC